MSIISVYRMGYRPGAADPPSMGGGTEGSEKWSRVYIYIYIYLESLSTLVFRPLAVTPFF